MTDTKKQPPENGLRRALDVEIVQDLLEITELRGDLSAIARRQAGMRASLQALNDKIDRPLALQAEVDEHSQGITRVKTIWSLVAAGIALVVATLKDWLLGQK